MIVRVGRFRPFITECVCWHPSDSSLIFSSDMSGNVHQCDLRQKAQTCILKRDEACLCVSVNPVERFLLATAGGSGSVCLWDNRNLSASLAHDDWTCEGGEPTSVEPLQLQQSSPPAGWMGGCVSGTWDESVPRLRPSRSAKGRRNWCSFMEDIRILSSMCRGIRTYLLYNNLKSRLRGLWRRWGWIPCWSSGSP